MEVTVKDVGELPAHTHLCVRFGDTRRIAPFRGGEKLWFPASEPLERLPKFLTVDVLRKVGQAKVSLAGLSAIGGAALNEVEIAPFDVMGKPITCSLEATMTKKQDPKISEASKKQQIALRAKNYLEKHGVQSVLHDMFAQLLEGQPNDPLAFMADFLDKQHEARETATSAARDFSKDPGLGDAPLPGFAGGDSALPDLSRHHSLVADVLRGEPGVYERLRGETTALGTTLAQCVKPGIDFQGHTLMKVAGLYAGDAECYDRFRGVFDPVIGSLHGAVGRFHPTDTKPSKIGSRKIDPTGRYAVFASMETRRNFAGLRFPTCCSREERRTAESLVTKALLSLEGEFKGSYLPLRASHSFAAFPGGMAQHQEDSLRKAGVLFSEPDSKLKLAAGLGRHWPDARGVFLGEVQSFSAWCNEEDHLRLFARQRGDVDLKALWSRLASAAQHVGDLAETEGHGFAHSDRLGFVTACPTRLGTALRCSVSLRVPLLAAKVDLPALCRSLQLQCGQDAPAGLWSFSNGECLGVSEVDIINGLVHGCATLVELEQRLERGDEVWSAMPGLGAEALPGFPVDRCPARLPDLALRRSMACRVLDEDPAIYRELRKARTSRGVSLAACIKPGIDDAGHGACAEDAGAVAGDAECYSTFSAFFSPLLLKLHGARAPLESRPAIGALAQLSPGANAAGGSCALAVRVELRRNLAGFRLPPCASLDERLQVERLLMQALPALAAEDKCLAGEYDAIGAMTEARRSDLSQAGLYFSEPTALAPLSAGLGRDWPHARGIFATSSRDLGVWCNEEDHLRVIATQRGGDLQAAFARASSCVRGVEAQLLRQEGSAGFARDPRLGFLTTAPEHVGGGFCCTVSMALPRLAKRRDFRRICEALRLRATWRNGAWDIATGSSLADADVTLANLAVEGCGHLARLERQLAEGRAVDGDVRRLLEVA